MGMNDGINYVNMGPFVPFSFVSPGLGAPCVAVLLHQQKHHPVDLYTNEALIYSMCHYIEISDGIL